MCSFCSTLYILCIKLLPEAHVAKMFLDSEGCLFTLLIKACFAVHSLCLGLFPVPLGYVEKVFACIVSQSISA